MKKEKTTKRRTFSTLLGFALGVATIVMGVMVLDCSTGSYADSASFGADFYTYMYKAGRYAANNIIYLAEIVKLGFGALLISLGGFEIIFFTSRGRKDIRDAAPVAPAYTAPVAPAYAAPTYSAPAAPEATAAPKAPEAPVAFEAPSEF